MVVGAMLAATLTDGGLGIDRNADRIGVENRMQRGGKRDGELECRHQERDRATRSTLAAEKLHLLSNIATDGGGLQKRIAHGGPGLRLVIGRLSLRLRPGSFVPQRGHRVHRRRATHGQVGRYQRRQDQHAGAGGQRQRVVRFDAEQ